MNLFNSLKYTARKLRGNTRFISLDSKQINSSLPTKVRQKMFSVSNEFFITLNKSSITPTPRGPDIPPHN